MDIIECENLIVVQHTQIEIMQKERKLLWAIVDKLATSAEDLMVLCPPNNCVLCQGANRHAPDCLVRLAALAADAAKGD